VKVTIGKTKPTSQQNRPKFRRLDVLCIGDMVKSKGYPSVGILLDVPEFKPGCRQWLYLAVLFEAGIKKIHSGGYRWREQKQWWEQIPWEIDSQ